MVQLLVRVYSLVCVSVWSKIYGLYPESVTHPERGNITKGGHNRLQWMDRFNDLSERRLLAINFFLACGDPGGD